jgi:hypothetical protein
MDKPFKQKTGRWTLSRIVILIIYHRHKPTDNINVYPVRYGQTYRSYLSQKIRLQIWTTLVNTGRSKNKAQIFRGKIPCLSWRKKSELLCEMWLTQVYHPLFMLLEFNLPWRLRNRFVTNIYQTARRHIPQQTTQYRDNLQSRTILVAVWKKLYIRRHQGTDP